MKADQWLYLNRMNLLSPSCDGIDKMTGTDLIISDVCLFVKSKCLALSEGCPVLLRFSSRILRVLHIPSALTRTGCAPAGSREGEVF